MNRILIRCAVVSTTLLAGCSAEWSPCEVECGTGLVCDPRVGACVKQVTMVDPQGEGGGGQVTNTGGSGGSGGGVAAPTGDLPCDVAAVIGSNCASCHGAAPSGGATFSLMTHADFTATSALDGSKTIGQRSVIRMRANVAQMPPAPNARVQAFDLNVIDGWVNSGMPSGTCAVKPGTSTGAGGGIGSGAGGGSTSSAGGGSGSGGGGGGAGVGGGIAGTGGGSTGVGGGAGGTGGGTTTNPNYCKSCTASSQCGSTKNFCLGSGTTGSCGTDCSTGQVCPSSAHCVQIVNASNTVVGSNCVPTSGVCSSGTGGGGGTTGTGGGGGGTTGTGGGTGATCTDTWATYAKSYFSNACASCHGTEFGTVSAVSGNKTSIRSRINSGNMPPGGSSTATKTRVLSWFDCGLKP